MQGINQHNVLGNLAADPEFTQYDNGNSGCVFPVAVNYSYKNKEGERIKKVDYMRCRAFGKTADLISQFFSSGDAIWVTGRVSTRKWQDDEGNDRYTTETIVERFQFLGLGKSANGATTEEDEETFEPEEELPF